MRPNRAARFAAVILALAGVSSMVAAGIVATRDFAVTVPPRHYRCGSVLFAKNPVNTLSRRRDVTPVVKLAARRCQKTSDERAHTATLFLLAGVVPLLVVLTLPALARRSRRARAHRRTRL